MLIDLPLKPKDVPRLDAVLVTHADNDHYSIPTLRDIVSATRELHSTLYVASLMKEQGWPARGHGIGDLFEVGALRVGLTAADHAWQNSQPNPTRHFANEDACGFWIDTPDGTIWAPGDSRLMPEHLRMTPPDAILFDFSDNEWHFGLQGAAKLANAYPNTTLLLSHWGTVDAPDFTPFNGDPKSLEALVVNPGRIKVLAPGEPFRLTRRATTSAPGCEVEMKTRTWTLVVVAACVVLGSLAHATAAGRQARTERDRDRFVGAWRLAWMEAPGPDGNIVRITNRTGTLMYTREGRTSVQIQFPVSESSVSNDYVLGGYEASFGTYEVNEEAQTITRHVEGSITRGLVGQSLTRAYRFADGRLTMRSVRPEERWSATWERY